MKQIKVPPPIKNKKIVKPKKTFNVGDWNASNEGEKVIIYGRSGIGKTTLAASVINPVFISIDDGLVSLVKKGGKSPVHQITGKPIPVIKEIKTFQDVRDALQTMELFDNYDSIVVDNITKLEQLAEQHILETIPHEKGYSVKRIEDYGYGKGYRHIRDTMLLVLPDFDRLVRAGKNIILLAQNSACARTNPGGEDFLEDGPRLYHSKTKEENSVRLPFVEWASHVFKVDYYGFKVTDKKIAGTTDRAIFVQPEVYFIAKSRTISDEIVAFESPQDDSIWQLLGIGVKK